MSDRQIVSHLGIIPARGGSKGLPKKNIRSFCGEPLICHSIRSAKNSNLNDVFVSTDCKEIANIAAKLNSRPDFLRPTELAQDSTNIIPVLKDVVAKYEACRNASVENVYLLQPTSPWRETHHINEAINLMEEKEIESVCSVVDAAGIHPFKMKKIQSGQLVDFIETGLENPSRQSLPQVYNVNGCIYAVRKEVLVKKDSLKGKSQIPIVMGPETSISIDTELDFEICEFLFKRYRIKSNKDNATGANNEF